MKVLFSRGGREVAEQPVKRAIVHQADEVAETVLIREAEHRGRDTLIKEAPKLVVATGISGGIVYGVNGVTSIPRELGRKIRDAPYEETTDLVEKGITSFWHMLFMFTFTPILIAGAFFTLRHWLRTRSKQSP
ncbi:MAG: hypothetical protein PF795_14975 [Kiritimatiellae bacterium]|nr:hypothetical protein [Kiritimatiellia bacterium]